MELRDLPHVLDSPELHALHLLRVELLRGLDPALEHQCPDSALPAFLYALFVYLAFRVHIVVLITIVACWRLPLHAVGLGGARARASNPPSAFSPSTDPFNPFALRSPDVGNQRNGAPRRNGGTPSASANPNPAQIPFGNQSPSLTQAANLLHQPSYNGVPPPPQAVPPHVYQAYMYQLYQQQNPQNVGSYHV